MYNVHSQPSLKQHILTFYHHLQKSFFSCNIEFQCKYITQKIKLASRHEFIQWFAGHWFPTQNLTWVFLSEVWAWLRFYPLSHYYLCTAIYCRVGGPLYFLMRYLPFQSTFSQSSLSQLSDQDASTTFPTLRDTWSGCKIITTL